MKNVSKNLFRDIGEFVWRELPLNDGAKTIIINGSWKSQERELTELEDFVYYIENPIEN